MKKVIFGVLLFVSVSLMARNYMYVPALSAYKTGIIKHASATVPQQVVDSFNNMFPSAKAVRWQVLTGGYGSTQYLAQFRLGGAKRTARFAPDGTYLGGT
jgi:hypothetical protein